MEGRWGQVTNDNVRASGLIPLGHARNCAGRWLHSGLSKPQYREDEGPVTRYFKVYVLPALGMAGAATVVRSLSLDSLTTGVLTAAIIVAWFVTALRIK
jgi:hypothetical protein